MKASNIIDSVGSTGSINQVLIKNNSNQLTWGPYNSSKWIQDDTTITPNYDITQVNMGDIKFNFNQFQVREDASGLKINKNTTNNFMKMEQYPTATTMYYDVSQTITDFIKGDEYQGYILEAIPSIPLGGGLDNNKQPYNLNLRVSGYLAMKIGALTGVPPFPLATIYSDVYEFQVTDKFYNNILRLPLKYPDYNKDTGFFDISGTFPNAIYDPQTQFPLKYRIQKWYNPDQGEPLNRYLQLEHNSTFDMNISFTERGIQNRTTFKGDLVADDIYGTIHSSSLSNSFSNYSGAISLGNTINFQTQDETLKVGNNTILLDGRRNSIGIATSTPTHTLHINKNVSPAFRVGDFLYCDSLNNNLRLYGSIKPDHIKDKNNTNGTINQVLTADVSGYPMWTNFDLSLNNFYTKTQIDTSINTLLLKPTQIQDVSNNIGSAGQILSSTGSSIKCLITIVTGKQIGRAHV